MPILRSRFGTPGGPQREDLDLAASAGNNNNNNQRFRWQEPPGKIIFVLFCFATCRDEEKETQNINVVGKTHPNFHSIFEAILAPRMSPKAFQNGAKIVLFGLPSSLSFFPSEGPDP